VASSRFSKTLSMVGRLITGLPESAEAQQQAAPGGKVKLSFRDPLTTRALELLDELESVIREIPVSVFPEDGYKMSNKVADAEQAVYGLIYNTEHVLEFSSLESAKPVTDEKTGLSYLLGNWSDVEKVIEATREIFAALQRCEVPRHYRSSVEIPKYLYQQFKQLRADLDRLTPAHAKLQFHLQVLILATPSFKGAVAVSGAELVEPLSRLRDAYFANPKPKLLTRYLELAEGIVADPRYAKYFAPIYPEPAKNHRAHIEAATVELEVLSMMESLDEDHGMAHA
jgi:hypothetical protein